MSLPFAFQYRTPILRTRSRELRNRTAERPFLMLPYSSPDVLPAKIAEQRDGSARQLLSHYTASVILAIAFPLSD